MSVCIFSALNPLMLVQRRPDRKHGERGDIVSGDIELVGDSSLLLFTSFTVCIQLQSCCYILTQNNTKLY